MTTSEAIRLYGEWAGLQVQSGAMAPGTRAYYLRHHKNFDKNFGERQLQSIRPIDLMLWGTSWHRVQAVKRLFKWSVEAGIADNNPVAAVPKPPPGQRNRVLGRRDQSKALRTALRPFREFLMGMRGTMARPQEIRELKWDELHYNAVGAMYGVQHEFKGRRRRRNQLTRRIIPISPRLQRLIERIGRRPGRRVLPFIFLNSRRRPWSANAARLAMARLRRRVGLDVAGDEKIVCYSWRHTAATAATMAGLRDKILAELMGHTSTRTTARYQHLDATELLDAYRIIAAAC
jgi:integrase